MQQSFLLFFLFFAHFLSAQPLTGEWQGELTQTGKSTTFIYQLSLNASANSIRGQATSIAKNSTRRATFQVVGSWDGEWLTLQETRQTSPPPNWCLKQLRLRFIDAHQQVLQGDWKATDCVPGKVLLTKQIAPTAPVQPPPVTQRNYLTTREIELPTEQAILGKWTGHLGQSDRDYGFYYEMDLGENGQAGTSFIVSEGNGGSANHALNWSFNPSTNQIQIKENYVATKTDSKWEWCLKNANLQLKKEATKYILTGKWGGYLEGHEPRGSKGKCAPGNIYLEKPILKKREVTAVEQPQVTSNPATPTIVNEVEQPVVIDAQGRELKVARTIRVNSKNLRIRVWDNGTVDGDVVTIFLNEKRIVNELRVTKTKRTFPIELSDESNFLIMHANDLGDIAPNTVALSIDDGVKEQRLIVSSNLAESGSVLIKEIVGKE